MSIAGNLKRALEDNAISSAYLAQKSGIETMTIRKYLAGTIRPSDAILTHLTKFLEGWTPEEIKYGKNSMRIGCQRGLYPFGTAYKRQGSSHYTYIYNPEAVSRWVAARHALTGGFDGKQGSSNLVGEMDIRST